MADKLILPLDVPVEGTVPYSATVPYSGQAPYSGSVTYSGTAPFSGSVAHTAQVPYSTMADLDLTFQAAEDASAQPVLHLMQGATTLATIATSGTSGWLVNGTVLTPAVEPPPPPPPGDGEVWMADAFVESIAVNIHPNFTSFWERTDWRDHFVDLGARYWRGSVGTLERARVHVADLYARAGARGLLLLSGGKTPTYSVSQVQAELKFAADNLADMVVAIEGKNEPNADPISGWAQMTRDYQKLLWDTMKATPALAGKKVLGPSIWRRLTADFAAVGDVSAWADHPVLHYYPGGEPPTVGEWDYGTLGPIEQLFGYAEATVPNKGPLIITEINYSNADLGITPSSFHMPPETAAAHMLRLAFLYLKMGVPMTALYALIDQETGSSNYGLLGLSGTGSGATLIRRPMFYALQRALALLSDPGTAFTPVALAHEFLGDLTDVQVMDFQKRDGTHVLALWQEVRSYDRATAKEIAVPSRQLTLTLPTARSIRVIDPHTGTSSLNGASTQHQLFVPARVMFVEVI